jgi:hypothetical protein
MIVSSASITRRIVWTTAISFGFRQFGTTIGTQVPRRMAESRPSRSTESGLWSKPGPLAQLAVAGVGPDASEDRVAAARSRATMASALSSAASVRAFFGAMMD